MPDSVADISFQSTHPLRGATVRNLIPNLFRVDFNPRTPCGVRRETEDFSAAHKIFQSTHPLRGATVSLVEQDNYTTISIHAPLAGCDVLYRWRLLCICYFNPRTPCGVRPFAVLIGQKVFTISIHAPLAGCDHMACRPGQRTMKISIHAPLAGCDSKPVANCAAYQNFNPRTPCGVRRGRHFDHYTAERFQSTHPLRGATRPNY